MWIPDTSRNTQKRHFRGTYKKYCITSSENMGVWSLLLAHGNIIDWNETFLLELHFFLEFQYLAVAVQVHVEGYFGVLLQKLLQLKNLNFWRGEFTRIDLTARVVIDCLIL